MAHAAQNSDMTRKETETASNGHDRDFDIPARETLSEMADAARKVAEDIAVQGRTLTDGAQKQVEAAHGTFADGVRRNPTASILGAVGVGVLVGLALRGRS